MDDKRPKSEHPMIDDPDAPPTEEEKIASERLRDALADPKIENADAELARALAQAHGPRELGKDEHDAIVRAALAKAKPRGRVIRITFGLATTFAVAAAAVLFIGRSEMKSAPPESASVAAAPSLVPVRSTQDLFDEPFAKPLSKGAASARIDRIAMARAGDLRENRFAMWGVR